MTSSSLAQNHARQIVAQLQDYAHSFALARQMQRQFHFYLGPTNSGKTHDALLALQQAESGVYLAPLRLLAMEVRDRLMAAGVPCNLVTGEERHLIAGARHTACTIEMMQPQHALQVAVIDEIQMLQDPARGSAWTAALVGMPANHVYVCGAASVIAPCERLLQALNESFDTRFLERKTPLLLEPASLTGKRYSRWALKNKLQTGDAVIVFSRKDALTLSARIRQWGFKVATIYGALSPEVRRTESNRFSSGEAAILVATDAIGMGLNLPIRRVVFSSTQKFDGRAVRDLNATEVRQIAGRAGRYGIYPTGYVSAFEDDELLHLEHMLNTSDVVDMQKLPVTPSVQHLQAIAEQTHTGKLSELLQFFNERITLDSPLFETASLGNQITIAQLIDQHAPQLSLLDKFRLSCAPVALDQTDLDYFLLCMASIVAGQARHLPPSPAWLASTSPKHLEEAENLSQHLSLYAWLSWKFPTIFYQRDALPDLRQQVSRYIERALLVQAGYQNTSKELLYATW
jgi:ATP-dependent RNA helicase SUPV3L1/SUV3